MNIKNILSKILDWYFDQSPLLSKEISYNDVQGILFDNFKTGSVVISDNVYRTISRNVLEKALKTNFSKYIQYRSEKFDCDDYSFVLCGQMKLMFPNIAFGIVQSKTHAFNFTILDDKTVLVVEPQTNKLYSYIEFKKMIDYYPAKLVIL